jgi:peptide/nickel transport system substrate-binding protein
MGPLFGYVASVNAVDGYTVRVTLRQAYAPLLQLLTVEILPSHLFNSGSVSQESFRKKPVGTGPFEFVSWEGDAITLAANDAYFKGRPYLDRVVIKHLRDKTGAWSELLQGKVSVVTDLDPEDYRVIESDPRFETYSYLDVFYYTVLLNNEDGLFSDPNIRQAVSLSLDRGKIIEESLSGWGDITTGPFIPGTWPYNEDVTNGLYDLEKARTVLSGSGWSDSDGNGVFDKNGESLTFELLIDEGDLLKEAVGRSVKWQLYEAGIKVDVITLDFQALLQERLAPGDYQAALLQFNAAGDPDTFISLFWDSERIGSSNLAKYVNPEVDRLIEFGRAEHDIDKRRESYRDIHRLIAEDAASVFLFVRRIYMGANSRIAGIRAQPQAFYRSVREWKIVAQ